MRGVKVPNARGVSFFFVFIEVWDAWFMYRLVYRGVVRYFTGGRGGGKIF